MTSRHPTQPPWPRSPPRRGRLVPRRATAVRPDLDVDDDGGRHRGDLRGARWSAPGHRAGPACAAASSTRKRSGPVGRPLCPADHGSSDATQQQTLRAAIDWSYELLAPDQRGSSLASASSPAPSTSKPPWTWPARASAPIDLLATLVKQSMVARRTGPVSAARHATGLRWRRWRSWTPTTRASVTPLCVALASRARWGSAGQPRPARHLRGDINNFRAALGGA